MLHTLPPKGSSLLSVVRETYHASIGFWNSKNDFAMLLGVVDSRGEMRLFSGNLAEQDITIGRDDKLIIFSNH